MSFSRSRLSLRPLALILVVASATSAALVGCSGTPEDEAPAAGTGAGASGGAGGSGGGGGSAGAATGGTAGAAAGTAGSGGNGLPDVGCDYTMALTRSCAITGCHNNRQIAGDLDLTPDAGLRSRLVNVTATHSQIICDPATSMECVPAACPTTAKLLDTANPAASWVYAKLGMTPTGCGDQMPLAPGNAADRWTEQNQACLIALFTALAGGGPPAGTGGSGGSSGGNGGSAGSATAGSAGSSAGGTSSGGGGSGGVASGGAGASSGGNAGSITAGNAGSGGARAGSGGQGGANGGVAGSL